MAELDIGDAGATSGPAPERARRDPVAGLPPGSAEEFAAVVREVEDAAREWGMRSEQPEGRFVAALMGAIGWSGRVSAAAQEEFKKLFRQQRETTERELATAREITRAARQGLTQADIMLAVVGVEKEKLIVQMLRETMPLFVERLQKALIIREQRWNEDVKRRRWATAVLVAFALYAAGYGTHVWQTWDAESAYDWCWAHPLASNGRAYCDMTGYGLPVP
jgi:hypothetical protein